MFDIGVQEMVLIMALALIVFGPSKLPELGKMIGRAMREFRRASEEFRSTVETNLKIDEIDSPPSSAYAPWKPEAVSPVAAVTPPVPGEATSPTDPLALTSSTEFVPEGSEASSQTVVVASEPGLPAEPYWAQRGSRLFHRRDCAWRARLNGGGRVGFESIAGAKSEGYMACPVCEPVEVGFRV